MAEDIRTDLVVRRHGRSPAEAPTLLFLHGLTDSGSAWPDAVTHWERDYAIVSIDQRGHGDSPRFTKEQLDAHPGEVMVQDAINVLEQLGGPPVVVGHSLGGAVALASAVRRPDLVRALVLEDPAPLAPGDPQRDPARGEELVAGLRVSLRATDEGELLRLRKVRHPTWSDAELLSSGIAEQRMDLDYLANGEFKPGPRWPELFTRVSVPALVVSGDALGEVCITEEMEKGVEDIGNTNVTVVRVVGAAHCIRREQPKAFYSLVDGWLARH